MNVTGEVRLSRRMRLLEKEEVADRSTARSNKGLPVPRGRGSAAIGACSAHEGKSLEVHVCALEE